MTAADLGAAHALSRRVHPNYPEDEAVLAEKLSLFAPGCFILEAASGIGGYCFSHPWTTAEPPDLNRRLGRLPPSPSSYFIHDLTLAEDQRRGGAARDLVERLFVVARQLGLARLSLVSVNDTRAFWHRMGFMVTADSDLQGAVRRKYGDGAVAMERAIGPLP